MTDSTSVSHYDAQYWQFQESIGRFGGQAELFKFAPHIRPTDRVIDYGCGGGFILASLNCKEKLGIEVNPSAREIALHLGINTVPGPREAPDCWADVVISNHALEHVDAPLAELKALRAKLKAGGLLVLVVPSESRRPWDPANINRHLYTWSPLNLGNLITAAGYEVIECKQRNALWPPRPQLVQKYLGWRAFHALSRIRGSLFRSIGEVFAVAKAA